MSLQNSELAGVAVDSKRNCGRMINEVYDRFKSPHYLLRTCFAFGLFLSICSLTAQDSVFPLGGQQGTIFEAKVRGFEGTYAAIFCCEKLKGQIRPSKDQVLVQISAEPDVEIGIHTFRLISPQGVSRQLTIQIHSEPTILEVEVPHTGANEAQSVTFPAVVDGKISQAGELDYYVIEVNRNLELLFEVITASGLISPGPRLFNEPQLIISAPNGSWFNPNRDTRVECINQSTHFYFPSEVQSPHTVYLPRLRHRFKTKGRFLLQVSSLAHLGGHDHGYQLRIANANSNGRSGNSQWTPRALVHPNQVNWQERKFTRRIQPDWIESIRSRSISLSEDGGKTAIIVGENNRRSMDLPEIRESTVNEEPSQAQEVKIPILIEGAIERPGDVDYYSFNVEAGDPMVFEIRTLNVPSPYFSPRLTVLDENGREILTNIYRYIGGDGDDWGKSLEPKTVHNFQQGGRYYLEIRDLTSRKGHPNFVYQVLIRPQIPHIGNVTAKTFRAGGSEFVEDRVNLPIGETRSLTIVFEREEGFKNDIAILLEHLPQGVEFMPVAAVDLTLASQAGQVYEDRATLHNEKFRPKRQAVTILLHAKPDATLTSLPRSITLSVRVLQGNKSTVVVPVQKIWLMVVKPPVDVNPTASPG